MSRMNRRRFTWVATGGVASATLVACSADAVDEDLTPTRISEVIGAPPTLVPEAEPFESEEVEEEADAPEEEVDAPEGEEAGADGDEEEAVVVSDGTEPITVAALDTLDFDPSEFSAAPGQEIHVVNEGSLQHDFVVDEWDLATELLDGGAEATVTVPEDAEIGSEVVYYCSVPGHREAGMEGTLTVVEAGAAGAEGAAEEEPAEEADAVVDGTEPISVTALDTLAFDPSEFSAAPGQEIHVVNGGQLQHDFVVDEWGLATAMLNGGEEETVTVPEDAEVGSEVVFYCSVPGHRPAGMEGTITVVEGGGGGAAAAEEEPAEETGEEEAAAAGPAEALTISALDTLQFDPSEAEVAPGQEIHVINEGSLQHDLVVDEWDLATALLNGGEEETVTVPEDAEIGSQVVFYCSVPGHRPAGMEGTFTVVEGGAAVAEEATEEEPAEEEAAAEEAAAATAGTGTITVEALDTLAFNPSELQAAPGQTINVVNIGVLQHDFVVDEWGLATSLLEGGMQEQITVPPAAAIGSTVSYYCSVPGHLAAGMEGTLTVVDPEGEGASADATPEQEATGSTASELDLDDNAIRVAALDSMRFAPSQFSAAPGQQIHLVNTGVLIHDIVIDEWDVDSGALGGGEETVFNIPTNVDPGTEVTFYCSVPGHFESGMKGTITVVQIGSPAAGEETPAPVATPSGTPVATPVVD